jgi:hypothetical protein
MAKFASKVEIPDQRGPNFNFAEAVTRIRETKTPLIDLLKKL